MSKASRVGRLVLWGIVAFLATGVVPFAQGPADNPYRPVKGLADGGGPSIPGGEWARLPGGREMGPPASLHVRSEEHTSELQSRLHLVCRLLLEKKKKKKK